MSSSGDASSRKVQWSIFGRLFSYITPYWELKAILVMVVLSTFLGILSPAIIGGIVDIVKDVASGEQIDAGTGVTKVASSVLLPVSGWVTDVAAMDSGFATLLVFSLSLVVIALLTGGLSFIQRYMLEIVSQRAGYDIRNDMYNSLLEQSFSFYDQQRTGQLMARATGDINMLGRFFNMSIRMALSNLLTLGLVVYSMMSLNLELTLVSLLVIPFLLYSTRVYSRNVTPLWRETREQNGVITSVLQENLSGLRVVRGFNRESFEEEKFEVEVAKFFDINITLARLRALFMPLATLIGSVGLVIILWYGGNQVMAGTLSVGSMVAFYFYMSRLLRPVRMLGFMTSMFVRANAAAERVFEIVDAQVDVSDKEGAIEIAEIEGEITFEDVWFSYDGKYMVLKDIDLTVESGQTVAILGATGSGKSSIINLVPRFYDVSKGCIRLDGVDIQDITIKSLRTHIGIVRQDPYIFSTTLKENIAYGVQNASLEGIKEAAKQAKINEFIEGLPEGYDTRVGERGVTLSGGQKQRVAIARALLKNPKILILDDSTSSVDTQTEYEIQKALDELLENRTTFIITQRLSSIKKADYIIVLEEGEIAEEGIHEDLMKLQGIYYKLYRTQIAGAEGGGS
ncbi:MAG: ABC transporter ATP-binding protein/permease [Candidatus Bathyarchaeota archaeon]|nr:ABC transporter ATP-binding protein/permease [Candidatus Bathyarchaeota archaeon]